MGIRGWRLIFRCCLVWGVLFIGSNGFTQSSIYNWDWKKDGLTIVSSGALLGASVLLLNRDNGANEASLSQLNKNDVWLFDRSAVNNYSTVADRKSDLLVFGVVCMPFVPYLYKKGRSEQGRILGMLLEAYIINESITNLVKFSTKRHRPFNYNPGVPLDVKLSHGSRLSFFSGHTSNTATFSFLFGRVASDLFSDSKWKPMVWAISATVPAAMGYLRYKAGKHFPTDVITGYIVGASIGYLVPVLHRNKNNSKFNLDTLGSNVRLSYKF